ncbi:hypothetical protein [Streptomyces lavendulocolor]
MNLSRSFQRIKKAAGLPRIRLHDASDDHRKEAVEHMNRLLRRRRPE